MSRLEEYYHDPHAPLSNSLAPTSFAVVRDAQGRVLLVQRIDTRNWELPGGKVSFGESALDAVVREVNEEAGILITVTGLAGIYTDPGHVMVYSSGEIRQQFALCFHATPLQGDPRPDHEETINAAWVEPGALDALPIHPSMRLRLFQAVKQPEQVHPDLNTPTRHPAAHSLGTGYSERAVPERCATAAPTPIAAATGHSITDNAANAPKPP